MPGSVITDMGSNTQFQRPARPEEVVPAYVYLASDADSSFVTGELVPVTGGSLDTR